MLRSLRHFFCLVFCCIIANLAACGRGLISDETQQRASQGTRFVSRIQVETTHELSKSLAAAGHHSPQNSAHHSARHSALNALREGERWADDSGAMTPPTAEVNGRIIFNKRQIFETVFLYGFDLQYSSDIDVEYELIPQATAMGHVPASFRRLGDKLQLLADQRRLFESDINHPEVLINEYRVVEENEETITVVFDRGGLLLNEVFNGAGKPAPKQTWIRSLKYDEAGSLLLQESALMLQSGAVQTFMESLFPRAALVPENYSGRYADAEHEPLADRYRFLANESVYMPFAKGDETVRLKTALINHYNIGASGTTPTIDFYVTSNVPEKFLPVIRSGVEGWNRYFGPQLGRQVMRFVGKLPEGVAIGDPRFNVISWDSVADAGAAYESSASDPTTGIQSHSLIYLPYAWYNIGASLWQKRDTSMTLSPDELRKLISPKGVEVLFGRGKRALSCARTSRGAEPSVTQLIRDIRDVGGIGDNTMSTDEFAQRLMIAVLFHEVGHSLGLHHNFKASLAFDGSKPVSASNPTTWSVMDYNYYQHEQHLFDEIGGITGPVLEYDRQAISQLYNSGKDVSATAPVLPACEDLEADDSTGGVDPWCQRYDSEVNPSAGIRHAYEKILKDEGGLGAEGWTLTEALKTLEEPLVRKFSRQGAGVTPESLVVSGEEMGRKAGHLGRYFVAAGAQSLLGNFSNNDKILRVWRYESLTGGAPGIVIDEASNRRDFHGMARESLSWKTLPASPARQLGILTDAVKAAVRQNPAAGGDDATRGVTAEAVGRAFTAAADKESFEALAALRKALYRNMTWQDANPFALRYGPGADLADFEGWSAGVLKDAALVNLRQEDQSLIQQSEDERMSAAKALRTFAGISEEVSLAVEELRAIIREGRAAGNQAQVDAARRVIKELE